MRKRRPFCGSASCFLAIQLYAVCSARINSDGMAHNPGRCRLRMFPPGKFSRRVLSATYVVRLPIYHEGRSKPPGFRLNQIQWYRSSLRLVFCHEVSREPALESARTGMRLGTFPIDIPWICRPVRRAGSASFFLFSAGPGSHRCSPLVRFDYNRKIPACQY